MTWSERFDAYIKLMGLAGWEVAQHFRVSPTKVHYWRKTSKPRDSKMRARIEKWSDGKVPAEMEESEAEERPSLPPTGTG